MTCLANLLAFRQHSHMEGTSLKSMRIATHGTSKFKTGSSGSARLEVHVPKLGKVSAHDLVGVHKDDLAKGEREQHVQEQDLVRPDYALLLRLRRAMR